MDYDGAVVTVVVEVAAVDFEVQRVDVMVVEVVEEADGS
jgi:hypothetical protein